MAHPIAIQCIDLSKTYGFQEAVSKLSLEVFNGEIFGFLGPNGAGKSTSIKMICGLLKPSSGQVLIQGENLRNYPKLSARIGVCPQENVFWPKLTGLEQLCFLGTLYGMSRKESKSRAIQLLQNLGLDEKSKTISQKWSGGMKRRLSIALALIHQPEILILDEPEAGLDPQSRVMVRDYIRSLTPDVTVLLTTHNMDEADRMAHRVAIIDEGKLIKLGTPQELKNGRATLEEVFIDLTGKTLRP